MREIKFRAWDVEMKCLIDWDMIQAQWEDEGYNPAILDGDHYEPMQYTGLHDKNGKEIYEGDILKPKYGDKNFEIKFEDGSWVDNISPIGKITTQGCEIIGNIYQNPELHEIKSK